MISVRTQDCNAGTVSLASFLNPSPIPTQTLFIVTHELVGWPESFAVRPIQRQRWVRPRVGHAA